jgi:hypothetical protein
MCSIQDAKGTIHNIYYQTIFYTFSRIAWFNPIEFLMEISPSTGGLQPPNSKIYFLA